MKEYDIAVISIFYNRATLAEKSVLSILDQTAFDAELNIIVYLVDDGSTDGTLAVLNKFSSDNVRVITQQNSGFTKTISKYVQLAPARLIAIHGSGDISLPDRLQFQAAKFDETQSLVLTATASSNFDPSTGKAFEVQNYHKINLAYDDFVKTPPFTHGAAMFLKSAYLQTAGYDVDFECSQDWDLWLQLLKVGDVTMYNQVHYKRAVCSDGASYNGTTALKQLYFRNLALQLRGTSDLDSRNKIKNRLSVHGESKFKLAWRDRLSLDLRQIKIMLALGQGAAKKYRYELSTAEVSPTSIGYLMIKITQTITFFVDSKTLARIYRKIITLLRSQ